MDEWFRKIAADSQIQEDVAQRLNDVGYVVVTGAVVGDKCAELAEVYDTAVREADPSDVSIKSSTRVSDFVNRGPAFDQLYLYPPLLAACCQVIGQPFKLSTMHSRTLNPGAATEALHVDFARDSDGWPMVGFIIMIDEFNQDNGATRFVPGSHMSGELPGDVMPDVTAVYEGQELACGPAGSIIIYNGSIWHGWTANRSDKPRRSIQGAYIRRTAESGANLPARMRSETLARISDLAKYLLNLEPESVERHCAEILLEEQPYTRAELIRGGEVRPLRGLLCQKCHSRIPQFADLKDSDLARIRQLIADQKPIMAIAELRDATGCSLTWGKLWVTHNGQPTLESPAPCPYCGKPLRTPTAKQCRHCLMDWHNIQDSNLHEE